MSVMWQLRAAKRMINLVNNKVEEPFPRKQCIGAGVLCNYRWPGGEGELAASKEYVVRYCRLPVVTRYNKMLKKQRREQKKF